MTFRYFQGSSSIASGIHGTTLEPGVEGLSLHVTSQFVVRKGIIFGSERVLKTTENRPLKPTSSGVEYS